MSCTCFINPPCSYCIEKVECSNCGKLVHPDDFEYNFEEKALCPVCNSELGVE